MEWISVEDRLPSNGQHVLVWDLRDNVYSGIGDSHRGQIKMGDAVYYSGQSSWDKMMARGECEAWGNCPDTYKSMNIWNEWSGQGPCSFSQVTHWMPLPQPPHKE